VTLNHDSDRDDNRPAGALLAGVCAGIAERLGWNTWAIRGLFVFGLVIQTIGTGVVYIILALVLPKFESSSRPEPDLKSDTLGERQSRISELERRFKEMEEKGSQDVSD
jgi:phage shock protein PspC (stress-responsive transcriptional regulator)